MAQDPLTRPEIAAILTRGEEQGCINLSELEEQIQALDLADADVDAVHDGIDARGIDVSDDCGRADAERSTRFQPASSAGWNRVLRSTPCSCSSTRSAATRC